jgi:hypothetical protein
MFDEVNATTIAIDIGCEGFFQITVNSTGCKNFNKKSTVRAACVILSRLIVTARYFI